MSADASRRLRSSDWLGPNVSGASARCCAAGSAGNSMVRGRMQRNLSEKCDLLLTATIRGSIGSA